MARIIDPSPEQEAGYCEWVTTRPPAVRAIAERFEPWSLYRLKTSNHRVTIVSFGEHEDGGVSLTVNVNAAFNFVMFERNVFGVRPEDLEPCELPLSDEMTGAVMSTTDVGKNIDALRLAVRPDVWEADKNGKAILRSEKASSADAVARTDGKGSE